MFFADDHYGGPNRFTGVRYYFNDDEGNQVVFFNWESAETEITSGAQHYAIYQNSRDVISDTWTDQTWAYENCSGNSGGRKRTQQRQPQPFPVSMLSSGKLKNMFFITSIS